MSLQSINDADDVHGDVNVALMPFNMWRMVHVACKLRQTKTILLPT